MDAAQTIRDCIADVNALRLHRTGDAALGAAVATVKTLQARRFAGSYADLMVSPAFGPAARFFLEELYSDKDYTARDLQFGRIAGTLQTMFPRAVVDTAGSVVKATVTRSIPELDAAAVQNAMRWRFEPYRFRGQPARFEVEFPVRFILR